MNRFSAAALCLLLAGCDPGGTSTESGTKTPEKDVVFVSGALLIPGDGTPPIEEATMIIENGVITKIGKKKEFYAPKGSLPIELEGKTIAPLFVNLHGYPGLSNVGDFGAKNYNRESLSADMNRYGYYGVGAVLAGGDSDGYAFQFRDELREGKASGATGATSCTRRGGGSLIVTDGPSGAAACASAAATRTSAFGSGRGAAFGSGGETRMALASATGGVAGGGDGFTGAAGFNTATAT